MFFIGSPVASRRPRPARPIQRTEVHMLVLSRKLGETICIGDDIRVTVARIDRGTIRLAVEAPRDGEVWRQEIHELRHAARHGGGQDSDPSDCDRQPA
jgi:carbon storage regulator